MATGGFGERMLTQMGWQRGTGLGARRDGVQAPLETKARPDKLGLGAAKPTSSQWADTWWESDPFKSAATAARAVGEESDSDSESGSDSESDGEGGVEEGRVVDPLLAACEGRRCRAAGAAKLERIRRYEEQAVRDSGRVVVEKRKNKKSSRGLGRGGIEKKATRKTSGDRKKRVRTDR